MYRLILLTTLVLAACRQDIGELMRDRSSVSVNPLPVDAPVLSPSVLRTIPADNGGGIGTNAKIHIVFSAAMDLATMTTNTSNTACSGTLQVSADNFITCVQMSGLQGSTMGTQFKLTPAANLTPNTRYKVRVTASAKSMAGISLVTAYDSTYGFNTASGADVRPPVIQWLSGGFSSPYEMESGVPTNTGLNVTFQEPMDSFTMRVNVTDTTCSGDIQLSFDVFTTCVKFSAQPVASVSGTTYTIFPAAPLNPSANYRVRYLNSITDLAGNPMVSTITIRFTTAATAVVAPFAVTSTTPTNGASAVSISPIIYVDFTASRPMDPTTLELNSVDTACRGSIQLSASNFSTCVPLGVQYIGAYYESVALVVMSPLANATTYKLRVKNALKDVYGNAITEFTQTTGFTTTATVTGGGAVSFLSPLDSSAVSNEIYMPFTVTFTRVMNPATLTAITSGSACSGSFMVSGDNFATCLPMSAQPLASAGNTRFTLYPQTPLAANTVYRTRISTAAQDSGAAAVTLYTGTGVTTMP